MSTSSASNETESNEVSREEAVAIFIAATTHGRWGPPSEADLLRDPDRTVMEYGEACMATVLLDARCYFGRCVAEVVPRLPSPGLAESDIDAEAVARIVFEDDAAVLGDVVETVWEFAARGDAEGAAAHFRTAVDRVDSELSDTDYAETLFHCLTDIQSWGDAGQFLNRTPGALCYVAEYVPDDDDEDVSALERRAAFWFDALVLGPWSDR
jgi:hypothetical protein